ncbi:hypothetical protein ERJ77_22330, partial [Vibrio anguillarum]|nr:hypothetical protein [Vibrio anguillarum]
KAKTKSTASTTPATPKGAIMVGLETNRTMKCMGCDVKIVLEGVAALLGWNANDVYEVGRKPAQGVPVNIDIKQEPLMVALEQIKADSGHIADIRIDPNFKSILIEYKSLNPMATIQ